MKYKLITFDGKVSTRSKMSLEQMQKFVGGYIELVNILGKRFYCNEDGIRLNLPNNKIVPQFVGNVIMEVRSNGKL